jgi:hypothetical protein
MAQGDPPRGPAARSAQNDGAHGKRNLHCFVRAASVHDDDFVRLAALRGIELFVAYHSIRSGQE